MNEGAPLLQTAIGGAALEVLRRREGSEIAMDGELDESGNIVDIELAHHAGAIGIDGFGTDGEAGGDFLGAQTFDEHGEYLVFAGREGFDGVVIEFAATLGSEDFFDFDRGGDVDAAIAHLAERIEELLRGTGLENKALGAAAKGLNDGFAVRARGHQDHAGIDGGFTHAAEKFKGVDLWKIEVEEGDIRPQFENEAESDGPIGALGDHIEIALVGAERGEGFPHERERFSDEETNVMYEFHKPAASLEGGPAKRASQYRSG